MSPVYVHAFLKMAGIWLRAVVIMLLLGATSLPLGFYTCLAIVVAYEVMTFRLRLVFVGEERR